MSVFLRRWVAVGLVFGWMGIMLIAQPGVQKTALAQSSHAGVSTPQAVQMNQKVYLPLTIRDLPILNDRPLVSTSLYMTSKDPQIIFREGCALGKRDLNLPGRQDSVVVLAFGWARSAISGGFGTNGYGTAKQWSMAEIAAAAENFGYGYWSCIGQEYESHLRVAIGTSNYQGSVNPAVNVAHGAAWAEMVIDVNDWFQKSCERGCDGQVDAVGANDIELAWNTAARTKDWLDGYASKARYLMYNFGAAEGCPWISKPGYKCNWNDLDAAWYVMWGADYVQPMPEIYTPDGTNAEQWYMMSLYSYTHHGSKIQFVGPMTEVQACAQEPYGCPGLDNSSENAWLQLYNLLNGDWRTAGEMLPYVTDIQWMK